MAASSDGFGHKTIGFWGSVFLICNNICGPGMVQIPCLFQQAGYVLPTLAFLAIAVLSYYATLFLSRAVSWMPGNGSFARRVELSGITSHLFPKWLYLATTLGVVLSFMAANIAAIVVSAQITDAALIAGFQKSCGLIIYDSGDHPHDLFQCISSDPDNDVTNSPFGEDAYVISIGYLVVMAITIPLGILNLDDNIIVQIGGVVFSAACVFVWAAQFIDFGLDTSYVPAVDSDGLGAVLPGVLFNYAFVITIPSWLNEKNDDVSIAKPNVIAIAFSTLLYLVLGLFGAFGLEPDLLPSKDNGCTNILSVLGSGTLPGVWVASKIAVFVFPITNLLSSIPVFSILMRYNLLNSGILSRKWIANLVAVALPWLIALGFYAGNSNDQLTNWSSALLFAYVNLIIPFLLYIIQYRRRFGLSDYNPFQNYKGEIIDDYQSLTGTSASIDDDIRDEDMPLLPRWLRLHDYIGACILFAISILIALAAVALQIHSAASS